MTVRLLHCIHFFMLIYFLKLNAKSCSITRERYIHLQKFSLSLFIVSHNFHWYLNGLLNLVTEISNWWCVGENWVLAVYSPRCIFSMGDISMNSSVEEVCHGKHRWTLHGYLRVYHLLNLIEKCDCVSSPLQKTHLSYRAMEL